MHGRRAAGAGTGPAPPCPAARRLGGCCGASWRRPTSCAVGCRAVWGRRRVSNCLLYRSRSEHATPRLLPTHQPVVQMRAAKADGGRSNGGVGAAACSPRQCQAGLAPSNRQKTNRTASKFVSYDFCIRRGSGAAAGPAVVALPPLLPPPSLAPPSPLCACGGVKTARHR